VIGWSLLCAGLFFYLLGVSISRDCRDPRKGLRLSLEEEQRGADEYLHGIRDPTQLLIEKSLHEHFSRGSRRLVVPQSGRFSSISSGVVVHATTMSANMTMATATGSATTQKGLTEKRLLSQKLHQPDTWKNRKVKQTTLVRPR